MKTFIFIHKNKKMIRAITSTSAGACRSAFPHLRDYICISQQGDEGELAGFDLEEPARLGECRRITKLAEQALRE